MKASESGKIDCNVALIGFMGTGKTTISNALSRITGFKEVDVDQYIVEKEGMAIKDIFAENGEQYFRDLETQALRDLQEEKETIISCGGGAVLRDENVEILNTGSVIVQLKATPETVFERVKDHTHRPILNNDMSVRHITELMNQRASYAIASMIPDEELTPENIIASPLNKKVADVVAKAVADTAIEEGIARV